MNLNPDSIRAWQTCLSPNHRVLILGASGWFGRTALALSEGAGAEILPIGQAARPIEVLGRKHQILEWNVELIRKFKPTIVLDLWFLTREKASELGVDAFRATNTLLIQRVQEVMALDSVEKVLSVSSGAAVHDQKNKDSGVAAAAYGELKIAAEAKLTTTANEFGKSLAIARAYSVTGAFVTRPRAYAFSDLLLQANSGHINIASEREVWRRYVAVEDVLAAGLSTCDKNVNIFSTGGPLVEIGQLAEIFSELAGGNFSITRPALSPELQPDNYFATDDSWETVVKKSGLSVLGLEEQALNVLESFRKTPLQ